MSEAMEPPANKRKLSLPILIAMILLIVFVFLFIVVVVTPTANVGRTTADVLPDNFGVLLAAADAARGAELVETIGCSACHVVGAANNVAPPFEGVTARAAQRQPPLTAEAYLYESIVNPNVYTVPDYPPSMPQNYDEVLSDEQLANIVAFLLTR